MTPVALTLSPQQIRTGRRWAYVTMLTMLSLSVAGNIAHTVHVNPNPSVRALVYAVAWPVMVWAAVELFVRVPWQAILTHRLVRWVGILLVAAIAGLVSYRHLRGLLIADGEEWTVYTFGPLAVDGLMLMSTLALLLTRALGEAPRKVPILAEPAHLMRRIAELEGELTERERMLAAKSAAPQIADAVAGDWNRGDGTETTLSLADVLPAPKPRPAWEVTEPADLTRAPSMYPFPMGPAAPLAGWTAAALKTEEPQPVKSSGSTRARRTDWDEELARKLLLAGATKADVARQAGTSEKTIQRLRGRMVKAGELTA